MNDAATPMAIPNDGMVNVRAYGAVGDGKADDTLPIREALAALPRQGGVLFFPPGHYLSDTIYAPSFTTLMGHAAWGYQHAGGTVLSPVREQQPRLIDLNGKCGTRIVGLTLHGRMMGAEMAGIFTSRPGQTEQNIVIDSCRVEQFSGCGFDTNESHVWCVRHSLFMGNRLDGLNAHRSFDGWIIDSMFTANGRYGLSVDNSTTITGNRIEHNGAAGLVCNRYYGQHLQITGNLFCSEHGPAIEMLEGNVRAMAITGNTFRNSARDMAGTPERDCHVRFEGVQGLVFTGNVLHVLWCNNPSYGMVLRGLVDSVVSNNTLFKGAMKELIRDLGEHRNTVISNNPGSLKDPKDLDS